MSARKSDEKLHDPDVNALILYITQTLIRVGFESMTSRIYDTPCQHQRYQHLTTEIKWNHVSSS